MREERVELPDLHPDLEGLVLAQLSDLHAGPWMGPGDLTDVVCVVGEHQPDLIVLTGDFLTRDHRDVERVIGELSRLHAPLGAYAVFGNHDYRGRQEAELARALAGAGVTVLRDASVHLERGRGTLALVGLEDLEEARVIDLDAALSGVHEADTVVALCHHPAGARALADRGVSLVLSGHTHGTQVDLPFLRRLGPAHPGLRIELGGTLLLVSRGLGAVGPPVRIGAPAEVVLVTLVRAPSA